MERFSNSLKFFRLIAMLLLTFIVSMYVFPIELTFLPSGLNTKKVLGVVGIIAYIFVAIRARTALFHNTTVFSLVLALVFSVWCYFSMVANGTSDDSYATYYMSFCVWLGGAYAVCALIRVFHGRINMPILVQYITFACVLQCVMALIIDQYPAVKDFVNGIVIQNQDFIDSVNRLYGVGASLDSGGCRFAVALVLLAHMIATNKRVTDSKLQLSIAIVSFLVITVIGNMIARTTTVGTILGLLYIFIRLGTSRRGILSARKIRFYAVFIILLLAVMAYGIYIYRTSPIFNKYLRFAFEGFFNYFEHGEFRTGSTDRLNAVMWIWPTNFHDWMIGTGWFGQFFYHTDIGYCRFTLYCGLIGLVIFSLFFVYNASVVVRKFNDAKLLAVMLLALTFIIWIKVATDIFWVYALLFCLPGDKAEAGSETKLQE